MAFGWNVTVIVQLAPAATLAPQLLVWEKSAEFVPVTVMLETSKTALPELVRSIVWGGLTAPTGWLPIVRLAGERLGLGAPPVPLRLTLRGLLAPLTASVTAAVRVPVAVGWKVTVIVQLASAASELPQVLDSAKSPALLPATAMLVIPEAWALELVSVSDWPGLGVPSSWVPKVRVLVERATPLDMPVPVRLMVCGLPVALSVNTTEAVRAPAALGVKVTLRVHWAEGASDEPQVLLAEKSPAFGPVTSTLEIFSALVPEFVKVSV